MDDVVGALLQRDYYQTVAIGFIEEAIVNSVRDNGGAFKTIDDLDKHIRENYI